MVLKLTVEQAERLASSFTQHDNATVPEGVTDDFKPFYLLEGLEPPIGWLSEPVIASLAQDNASHPGKECWIIEPNAVSIAPWLVQAGKETITEHLQTMTLLWSQQGHFGLFVPSGGYEQHDVYGPLPNGSGMGVVFQVERDCVALFGFQDLCVSVVGWAEDEHSGKLSYWVQKRSAHLTYAPSLFDCLARGGLKGGLSPLEGLLEECEEEASLPKDWTRSHVKADGHFFAVQRIVKRGIICLDVLLDIQYTLQWHEGDPVPKPNDGEVESFQLMDEEKLLEAALNGKIFAPLEDLLHIHHLWRKGRLDLDEHPSLIALIESMRRKPVFEVLGGS